MIKFKLRRTDTKRYAAQPNPCRTIAQKSTAQPDPHRARYEASNEIRPSDVVFKIYNGIKSYAASNEIRSTAGE
ncbi:hypothetical protein [uncultured Campylobacter sp.]|uniref:hypothetical protein n=1 Tax=uncultured Campylobacter sp. TaxID=218934 RepID=UPI00260253C7|nr:hypothetical protein [uncultured Campylobacter sp.]